MVIQVDNKELMDFFESWLEDFKRVSEGMLEKINVDRGATLKIPESDFRKLKMLTESLDGLAKKKFGFENAPDFTPMVGAMKRLESCIEKIYIPEKIEVQMPEIEFPAIPAPVVDFSPLLQGIQDLSKLMQQGISASITNFDQMPLVFDKTIGGAGGVSGGGDATEATLQSILSALNDVVTNTAAISIDADSVNLNTDTLEALITSTNTKLDTLITQTDGIEAPLATLAGAVSGTEVQVDVITMPTVAVTGTFWQATQPVSLASVPSHNVTNAGTFATQATLQAGTAYAGKVRLTDGTTDTDVRDLTNSNALNVAIVDGSGDQITTFGGGTQYTEGDTDASITGTAMMWEDGSDTLRAVSAAKPLPVNIVAGASSGTEYTEDAAAAANPAGGALILVREDARAGGLTTTDGDNVAARGNNKGELYVKTTDSDALLTTIDADTSNISTKIDTLAGAVSGTEMQVDVLTMPTVAVTGTFWQATQPVSLASVPSHAVTNAGTFAVQATEADGANVTLGAKADAKSTATDTTAVSIMSVLKQISASVQAPPSQAVTNAGTFAVQPAGSVAHDAAGTGVNPVLVGGYASAAAPTSVSTDGDAVRAWYLLNGAQATVLTAAGALIGGDAANGLDVDVTRLPALVAGTAVIGKVGIDQTTPGTTNGVQVVAALPAGTNNIGDVDVLTIPGIVGTVADDATTPGAPVMIGGTAVETDGTDPGSVSAEDDVVRARFDRNRRQLVNDMHPNSFVLFEDHTTAQTNNQLKAAPGANLSIYITDVIFSNGATAGSIKLVEDEGGTPVQIGATVYMAINGGAVMNFKTPKRLTANKSLGFTSTTVTTHAVEIHGYIAP